MKLYYQKGKMDELDNIFTVFQEAIKEMNQHQIPQWDERYPQKQDLQQDIEHETLYVGKIEDEIAVVFVINQEIDPQYTNGHWRLNNSSYGVLHRFCVSPKFQNCGLGARTLDHIHHMLLQQGMESVRLDVFSLNPYARKLYEKAGYLYVGEVEFRKGTFYLMEKGLIESSI